MSSRADKSQNYTQCDSLLIGDTCSALTIPYIKSKTKSSKCEHEATTSKVSEEQLFYLRQRGMTEENAVNLIVNGFVKEVTKQLPMEFAVEANKLLSVTLEGAVG
jgi:Fe-S cluster assembly protein SufB